MWGSRESEHSHSTHTVRYFATPSSSGAMTDSGDGDLWNELRHLSSRFCWTSRLHCHRRSACRRPLPAAPGLRCNPPRPGGRYQPCALQQVRKGQLWSPASPLAVRWSCFASSLDTLSSSDAIGNEAQAVARKRGTANRTPSAGMRRWLAEPPLGTSNQAAFGSMAATPGREAPVDGGSSAAAPAGRGAAAQQQAPRVASLDSAALLARLGVAIDPGASFYRTSMSNMGRRRSATPNPSIRRPRLPSLTPNARAKSPFGANGAAAPPTPQSYSAIWLGRDTSVGGLRARGAQRSVRVEDDRARGRRRPQGTRLTRPGRYHTDAEDLSAGSTRTSIQTASTCARRFATKPRAGRASSSRGGCRGRSRRAFRRTRGACRRLPRGAALEGWSVTGGASCPSSPRAPNSFAKSPFGDRHGMGAGPNWRSSLLWLADGAAASATLELNAARARAEPAVIGRKYGTTPQCWPTGASAAPGGFPSRPRARSGAWRPRAPQRHCRASQHGAAAGGGAARRAGDAGACEGAPRVEPRPRSRGGAAAGQSAVVAPWVGRGVVCERVVVWLRDGATVKERRRQKRGPATIGRPESCRRRHVHLR